MIKLVSKSWLLPVLLFTSFLSMTNAETNETTADISTQATTASSTSSSSTTVNENSTSSSTLTAMSSAATPHSHSYSTDPNTLPTTTTSITETSVNTTVSLGTTPSSVVVSTTATQNEAETTTATSQINCGNVPHVPGADNKTLINGSTEYPTSATYECKEGYVPSGNNSIHCQSDGNWSTTTFSCTIQDCGNIDLEKVPGANITYINGSTKYPNLAEFSCNAGYKPYENELIQCQSNGNWSITTFGCTIQNCGDVDVEKVPGANITYINGSTKYPNLAEYSCNAGYKPYGNEVINCQSNGSWSITTFGCTIQIVEYNETCFELDNDENACNTTNATCTKFNATEKRCLCTNDDVFIEAQNGCFHKFNVSLSLLKMKVIEPIEKDSVTLFWDLDEFPRANFSTIKIDVLQSEQEYRKDINLTFPTVGNFTETISGLKPGEHYTFKYHLESKDGIPSNSAAVSSFTKPLPLGHDLKISNITEDSFTVSWKDNKTISYTHYVITIQPSPVSLPAICNDSVEAIENSCIIPRKNTTNTTIEFTKLRSGENYTVEVYTLSGGIISDNPSKKSQFTRPTGIEEATITNITNSSLTVKWNNGSQQYDHYIIVIDTVPPSECNYTKNHTIPNNSTSYVIPGLCPAVHYVLKIYTYVGGVKTDEPLNLSSFTRPSLPSLNDTITNVTEESFTVQWSDEENITYSHLSIIFSRNVTKPDKCNTFNDKNCTFEREKGNNSLTLTGLDAGTEYTLWIFSINAGLLSENNHSISTYTVPLAPRNVALPEDGIKNNSFVINLRDPGPAFTNWTIEVIENKNNKTAYNMTYGSANTDENVTVTDSNIMSGTPYTAVIFTSVPKYNSRSKIYLPFCTISNDPESVQVSTVHERNVSINITTRDDRYSSFLVLVCSNGSCINTYENTNETEDIDVVDLEPATNYTITVYTVNANNLTSRGSKSLNFTTRPETPVNGSVSEVNLHRIGLDFSHYQFDSFFVQYYEANQTYNFTVNTSHNQEYIVDNLTAGTLYEFEVYTYFQGLLSDGYDWITSYTKPEQIDNLNVSDRTNTSLQLQWDPPNEGNVDNYTLSYSCTGPNDGSHIIQNETSFSTPNTTISGLSPGTFCIASITTTVGNQVGNAKQEALPVSTVEDGPDVVEVENITSFGSRFIDVQWKIPSKRNGLITKYIISASLNGTPVKTKTLNCTVCTMQKNLTDLQKFVSDCASASRCDNNVSIDSLHSNFTILHPFRTYTFSIMAFTKYEGKMKTTTWATAQDIPDGPPQNINGSTDRFMIKLRWEPPRVDVRNGIITNYTVQYSYDYKPCSNSPKENETKVTKELESNETETNLTNLLPFTDYRIQIKARTYVGYGNYSENTTFRTNQSVPSKIDINKTSNSSTNESITLKWETPCRPNGIITNYTINITNIDTGEEQLNSTKSNATNETIQGLMPYRNYTISISGNTIAGGGNYSDPLEVTTAVGIPEPPENLMVNATSSSKELFVTWNKPTMLKYTGPTHYVVVAEDKRNRTAVKNNTVLGFKSNSCTVEGLEEYWNYTVTVTAITKAGNATSVRVDGQTKQDVPLEVETINVSPQSDVTQKRSIYVKWSPPTERNQNGIITHYFVAYSSKTLERRDVFRLSPASNEYTIVDISPGNYTITVYAATIVGNGTESNKSTELLPGAPLKVPETNDSPLMRAASLQVSNKKKEIAVELPTDSLLCNSSNGDPKEWGVIVAQDDKATDTPFNGKKTDFEKKMETYKTWSSVKDEEVIPPYIATPSAWSPCSFDSGTRRRRSAHQTIKTFTVGEDGDCKGRCNGALQPGRDYRVKSYVCTQTGCTETLYSKPIATDPDPTIPIVAGVVSALVVIAAAGVIVFFLRRKQVACFAKDVETTTTHRAGNEISLDKIEPKQSNAFRPGPIKLTDFPQAVEKMHRDSDLLFADAYKLLKEKSPNHPLTAAEQQCSRPKNRYTNILPFDHSRVKLRPSDDIEGSDYINANYIPGYSSRREYIATQGPMQATFDDFWRMVWEQNVDTVVMLTKLMEKGRRKCDKYWPDINEPVFYGDLVVSLQSESNLSDYTIKIFEVKMKEERKVITHFSYLKWPDMGCPETPELLLDFVKAVRQYTNRDKKESPGPVVVHCSAGVGRTGTFIAVDYLLQHIRDHDEVDIYNLVLEMRNHRLNMVQTEDQYVYIHECLKAFITTDEEEEDEEEEPVYMNTNTEEEHIYVNTAFTKE